MSIKTLCFFPPLLQGQLPETGLISPNHVEETEAAASSPNSNTLQTMTFPQYAAF